MLLKRLTQLLISSDPEDLCETHPRIRICCLGSTSKKKKKKKKKMSTPIVVVPDSSGIYDRKANVKVHSYYTSICVAVPIYRLLFAASHCSITPFQIKLNLTFMRYRNAVHRNFCAGRCSAARQLNCGGVWTDLNISAEQPKMANPGEQTTT